MPYQVSYVTPEYIDSIWWRVEALVESATDYSGDRYSPLDIYRSLVTGDSQLWAIYEGGTFEDKPLEIQAVVITRMEVYPGKKMLSIRFGAGTDVKNWKDPLLTTLEDFSIRSDCDGMEFVGRGGWIKMLAENGWKKTMVLMEKDLRDYDQSSQQAA